MLSSTIVDEFGYLNLKPEQSNTFFKLMEERYHRHSTIITTNLVYDEWQNFLGNKSMVEALLTRQGFALISLRDMEARSQLCLRQGRIEYSVTLCQKRGIVPESTFAAKVLSSFVRLPHSQHGSRKAIEHWRGPCGTPPGQIP